MTALNTWLPGNKIYSFNDGVVRRLEYKLDLLGAKLLCESFVIPNAQAGFGTTFDMISPAFAITKPPKVSYSSTSAMNFLLKDSDGWVWIAPCPMQVTVAERGWAWSQFALHTEQTNIGTLPTVPATGVIAAFQFSGAEGVHGVGNNVAQTISIQYLAGRSPVGATAGDIRQVSLTNLSPLAHTWKVGTVELVGGTRKPVKYMGSVPFGLQLNGPRTRLAVLPYRGPLVAGYQSGTPWVASNNNVQLGGMLDFMLEAQAQFTLRSPTQLAGPWMHIYLQALWDCEQNGDIDTWVWDGPDGNPAWDGWQYRAFDSMGRTWYEASKNVQVSSGNVNKLKDICTPFADWLYGFFVANPLAMGVPNDWRPAGWVQGVPFPANSYLDPKYTSPSSHDIALALKGVVFSKLAGYSDTKARYMIHRLLSSLAPLQVPATAPQSEMQGAFTLNPVEFEVYGFEQGEVLEALALCKQHPELLTQTA